MSIKDGIKLGIGFTLGAGLIKVAVATLSMALKKAVDESEKDIENKN